MCSAPHATYPPHPIVYQATPDLLASRLLVTRPTLPLDRAPSLLSFLHGTVPFTGAPLLHLCPVKGAGVRQPFSPQGHMDALFVEVGVYGRVADGRGREHARRLECFVAAQVCGVVVSWSALVGVLQASKQAT